MMLSTRGPLSVFMNESPNLKLQGSAACCLTRPRHMNDVASTHVASSKSISQCELFPPFHGHSTESVGTDDSDQHAQ